MRIIESISRKGIRSSAYTHQRLSQPHPGDVCEYESGKFGIIDLVDDQEKKIHVCLAGYHGSVFLNDSGTVSISGGPFQHFMISQLEPTIATMPVDFWNWGDNLPGADMGCSFTLKRPVFKVKEI